MESFTEAFLQFLPERDAGHLANTALMPYRTAKPYFELVQRLRLWTEYHNERWCFLCNDNPSCESLCKHCSIVGLCVDCHFVVQGTFTWAPEEEEGWLPAWGDTMCLMCGIDTEVLGQSGGVMKCCKWSWVGTRPVPWKWLQKRSGCSCPTRRRSEPQSSLPSRRAVRACVVLQRAARGLACRFGGRLRRAVRACLSLRRAARACPPTLVHVPCTLCEFTDGQLNKQQQQHKQQDPMTQARPQ